MFKPLTESDVTFTFTLEAEQESPRGHFGYDSEEENKAAEDSILERLERGDERAWCYLRVTATAPDGTEESDSLGCVDLGEDAGWGDRLEAHVRATFPDLWTEALARLNETLRQKATPRNMRMVTTRYAGPTDNRGSRVHAKHVNTGKRASVAWDHALDSFENHAAAAAKLLGCDPEFYSSVDGGGYIMGVDPRNDPSE